MHVAVENEPRIAKSPFYGEINRDTHNKNLYEKPVDEVVVQDSIKTANIGEYPYHLETHHIEFKLMSLTRNAIKRVM